MLNKEKFLDTKIYVPSDCYIEFQELIKKIFGTTNEYPRDKYYFIVKTSSISDVTCETPVNIVRTQEFFYNHSDLPELHISDLRHAFKIIVDMKPTDFVLAKDDDDEDWELAIFHHYSEEKADQKYPYITMDSSFSQCIPYKGNEHLFKYHPNHIVKK